MLIIIIIIIIMRSYTHHSRTTHQPKEQCQWKYNLECWASHAHSEQYATQSKKNSVYTCTFAVML